MNTKARLSLFSLGVSTTMLSTGCMVGTSDFDDSTGDEVATTTQEIVNGCHENNSVPLQGPNASNRVGSNACVAIIPPFLPSWWQYSDGTARVQIANYDDQDPNENAFPLTVHWENTCGTESGSVVYEFPWQQHELGHPDDECSIVISLGGKFTEDVLVFWGA